MKTQRQTLSGTAEVNGTAYQYLVTFSRDFAPGAKPKFWEVGDICERKFTPLADERTAEDLIHLVLKRINTDPNARPPVEAVADALRKLVEVAAQMGSVDLARKIGSDRDGLQGMYERGQKTLMDRAIALYEALQPMGDEASRYFLDLNSDSDGNAEVIGVCRLPKAEPPPPPASQRN